MATVTLVGPGGPDPVRVVVDPEAGCRLASIVVGDADGATELFAETPHETTADSTGWGSFPMAPWAGRLRHGRFSHPAGTVHLGRNHRDATGAGGAGIRPVLPPAADGDPGDEPRAHSIHGTVFGRPWTLDRTAPGSLSASCELGDDAEPGALGWPFGGTARQTITVRDRAVDVTLAVEAADTPFAAVVGWHPWFAKPDRLGFSPRSMYERDASGLPTGHLVDPTPPPWDDCFVADGPVELHYGRAIAPRVRVSSDCDHWVVFDRPARATCVEPQSGPPDAVNLGVGADVVAPGAPLRRTMTIAW